MNTLIEFLEIEGDRIHNDFMLASKFGSGTPQEIADFRENAVQTFVKRFYPRNFVVTKGKITSILGNQSNSIDCLILDPAHPDFIDSSNKFRLIFADACDHAIEVKPDLGRADELIRALKQGESVKSVKRSKCNFWTKKPAPHIVEHSLFINFVIFSIASFEPIKLYEKAADYYINHKIGIENQVDAIFILGSGLIRNVKHKEIFRYGEKHIPVIQTGWYFEDWGRASLVGFLTQLEQAYKSQPLITNSAMSNILHKSGKFAVRYLGPCV